MSKHILSLLLLIASTLLLNGCESVMDADTRIQCQDSSALATVLKDAGVSWNAAAGSPLELNPETLRILLLNGNMTLFQAANRVHQAKDTLNQARANLLPSINLGVLIQSSVNPTFLLASVDFALPFLLPSRWFDMYSKKYLTKAEEMAFLATQLNQYSSLFALYLAIQADYISRDFLAQDIQDAMAVERLVSHSYDIGQATAADLDLSRSQVLSAENRQIKLEELLTEEMASLRYALAICPEVPLLLTEHELPASRLETLTATQAANEVITSAPESKQMDFLLRAAEFERWSKIFGFLSAGSIAGSSGSSNNPFSNLDGRGQMGIGFGYATAISLSNRNIEALRLRKKDLGAETLKTLDSSLSRMDLIAERIDHTAATEQLLENVFESEKRRYAIGDTTLLSLTEAQGKLRQTRLEEIKTRFDQKLERLNLHRFTRTEVFAPIQGCAGHTKDPSTLVTGIAPCDSEFVQRKLGQGEKREVARQN